MIIRIRGLHKVHSKGRVYLYHRRTGQKINADPRDPAAVLAEVNRLDGKAPKIKEAPKAGTLGALIAAYRASPEFTDQLKPRTRKDYQRIFDYLRPMDALALAELSTPNVIKIRDKAFADHKRHFANYVVAVLSILFNWGKPRGWVESNPAAEAPKVRRPKGAPKVNRPWGEDELVAVMTYGKPQIRLGVALGVHACLREGDVVAFPKASYNGTEVEGYQGKTDEKVWLPAHRDLRAAIAAWDAHATAEKSKAKHPWPDSITMLVNERGLPYTVDGFRAVFFKLVRQLTKAGLVRPGLTFHGLRHTSPTKLAEMGVSKDGIKSVTGHLSDAAVNVYIETANRRKLARAAVRKLEGPKRRRTVV